MKNLLNSITNASTLADTYTFDRSKFYAGNAWTRSLLSGAISTGLTGIGVYTGYLAMDSQFASALSSQAVNFKLACGAVIACLLGYSLRDLMRSITLDVKSEMHVARANSWLDKGEALSNDKETKIKMQQTSVCMTRFVEVRGGIKVYCLAKQTARPTNILIEALLMDDLHEPVATYYSDVSDIRAALNHACGQWGASVAEQLGISLSETTSPPPPQQSGATRLAQVQPEEEFDLDDALLDEVQLSREPGYGVASKPRNQLKPRATHVAVTH
ncbi:hypothetical protein ACI77O_12675 [Pseudomonas tritici]|uniref:hypothetical protein n=1 Tax=Pseudomonas tritici TaxID=2745518 RepID=UPI00387AA686